MAYCKYCGAELPDIANFCTKCGAQNPIEKNAQVNVNSVQTQPVQPAPAQPAPAQPQNKVQPADSAPTTKKLVLDATWFKENFMALFVILGVVSVVLLQFATMIAFSTFGFGVFLGVLAIICSIAFCAVGVGKYFITDRTATLGKKHSTGDVICFALGIICFVYVLVTTIVVLKTASDLLDVVKYLSSSMINY